MICDICKFKETCEVPMQINDILDNVYCFEDEHEEDAEYIKRVVSVVKDYNTCSEYQYQDDAYTICISMKEYLEFLKYKAMYEGNKK